MGELILAAAVGVVSGLGVAHVLTRFTKNNTAQEDEEQRLEELEKRLLKLKTEVQAKR